MSFQLVKARDWAGPLDTGPIQGPPKSLVQGSISKKKNLDTSQSQQASREEE